MLKNINNFLSKFKDREVIKNKLEIQVLKKLLEKKFSINDISFQDGELELKVKDSVHLQELSFKKEEIKKEINKNLGKEIVKEVIVRRD
jgi:hypothetical protein